MARITTEKIHRPNVSINETYIGIDTALRYLGVCILYDNTVQLSLIDTKDLLGPERLLYIKSSITDLISDVTHPVFAAVEAGAYDGGGRLFQLGQAQGIAQIALAETEVPQIEVSPTRLKKFFAGHGLADKDKMIDAARSLLDIDSIDDNLADAFALARVVEACRIENPRTRKQAEVILDLESETAHWMSTKSSD